MILQAEATRRLRAVLFVDMVDSVRIMSLDEAGTVARWRELMAAVAAVDLPKFGGRRVKLQGDGMLAEFESTVGPSSAHSPSRRARWRSEEPVEPQRSIRLRMGVHVADVFADEFDIYGDGVNLAARLRDLGGPDEIVVSAAVRDQLTDGLGVAIEDLGERR